MLVFIIGFFNQITQLIDQRLQPVNQLMQRMEQGRTQSAQQLTQQVGTEVEQFTANGQNEFFEDVRTQMADIIEIQAKSGRKVTLKEAYDTAVALRPDIQEIIQGRSKQQELASAAKGIGRKKQAASSVTGSPASATSIVAATLRGTLEEAWDSAGQEA